jgi:hypothetical protein
MMLFDLRNFYDEPEKSKYLARASKLLLTIEIRFSISSSKIVE